jgi:protein O-mannosyl-transferase
MTASFKSLLYYLSIPLLALFVYAKTFGFQIIYLDDNVWIEKYRWYFEDLRNTIYVFHNPDFISNTFWRPLLNLSFFLDAQWPFSSLIPYRLTNFGAHILNGYLLLYFFDLLKFPRRIGYVFTLIFIVHPALTSAVAWIPGRTESIFSIMFLISVIFYIQSISDKKLSSLVSHYIFLVFALLSKETAIVLPVLCLLYSACVDRSLDKTLGINVLLWTICLAGYGYIHQHIILPEHQTTLFAAIQNMKAHAPSLVTYLGKAVLPFNLSVLPDERDMTFFWGGLSIILLGVACTKVKSWGMWIFGLLWFVLLLIPTFIGSFVAHEYRLYLPLVGIFIILGSSDRVNQLSTRKYIWETIIVLAVLIFGSMTIHYSLKFREKTIFWENAITSSPHSALAHRNRGAIYHIDGKLREAEEEYLKSIELEPTGRLSHGNLGLIYFQRGEYDKAKRYYLREIQLHPTYDQVYLNLGILYLAEHKDEEGTAMLHKALDLNSNLLEARIRLYLFYTEKGDLHNAEEASAWFKARGIDIHSFFQKDNE